MAQEPGGKSGGKRGVDKAPRGGATLDPDLDLDSDPIATNPEHPTASDSSAAVVASPEKPVSIEASPTGLEPITIIPSGVLSIETDGTGAQTVKIINPKGEEHRYKLDLTDAPDVLIKEIGATRQAVAAKIQKLRNLKAPEKNVSSKLAELAMLDRIIVAVVAVTPTEEESRAIAREKIATARAIIEQAEAARAAAARAEAIARAEQESEVDLEQYLISLGIDDRPEAGRNKGKMVIKIGYALDPESMADDNIVEEVYGLDDDILNLPEDIVALVQQARKSLFDRHDRALQAEVARFWAERDKAIRDKSGKNTSAEVKVKASEQVLEQTLAPIDAEVTEAEIGEESVAEPEPLSRQELNQLHTLTEIEVAYIDAVYQDQYAGGEAQGKENMLNFPKDMMDTVKELVLYFNSRRLAGDVDVFLSQTEQKQFQVLTKIYAEHTAQARQAHIEHWNQRLAAEKEYRRLKTEQAGTGKGKADTGKEARTKNIPADVLEMAQNPGGFLIKSGRGDTFAIQVAEALEGKKGSTWEVFVVSDGGSQYVQEGQTFEFVKKGDRMEMKGMNPTIAKGLETFVAEVGVGSLSQDLQAFYKAHMQVKRARDEKNIYKLRRAPELKPVLPAS